VTKERLTGPSPAALAKLMEGAGAITPPSRVVGDLGADIACARVAGAPHSIAEIVGHLHYWQSWVLDRAGGADRVLPEHASEGWPRAEREEWAALQRDFLQGVQACRALALEPGAADRDFPWGASVNALGYTLVDTALHNAHHLGQVVTLRQVLGAWPPLGGGVTW
jgi:uncharacterized damage-inducible protein DinB